MSQARLPLGAPPVDNLQDIPLPYTSHNPSLDSTIVLIHGAFVLELDWDLVIPHLNSYHVLVPDLPGHGMLKDSTPFSVEYSSRLLAQLIRNHAINGKAHIIGHSLGAHVAINLASLYPELINDVFISGFEIYPLSKLSNLAPYAILAEHYIQKAIPQFLIKRLMDGTDIPRGPPPPLDLCRQIAEPLISDTWPSSWSARTLIVAAGKGGIIPSKDHPHDAVKLRDIGRVRNEETGAVTHGEMRHPWNRQAPRLFAEFAEAWFERKDFPDGFVEL